MASCRWYIADPEQAENHDRHLDLGYVQVLRSKKEVTSCGIGIMCVAVDVTLMVIIAGWHRRARLPNLVWRIVLVK